MNKIALCFLLFTVTLMCSYYSGAQVITTIAGKGTMAYTGDGGPATAAELNMPWGIAMDAGGNIFIGDQVNNAVRKINTMGIIFTIAGNGIAGYSGDGGPATAARLTPLGVAVDNSGNVFIADANNYVIRMINTAGIISTVAGNGSSGNSGNGGPATAAQLSSVTSVAADKSGNIYIADVGNNTIRKVNAAGIITTVAGNDTAGFSGDGGQATNAKIQPAFVAVDAAGNIFIADGSNQRVRKVSATGIITTIAGNGSAGYTGDSGPATAASLHDPLGLRADDSGNVFIADFTNYVVRKIDKKGIITTVAGNNISAYSGDGGLATAAALTGPVGVASDVSSNVYILDQKDNRVRKVIPFAIPLSVNLPSQDIVSIFPNPNNGNFTLNTTLHSATDQQVSVEITNVLGQVVYKKSMVGKNGNLSIEIELNDAANGFYQLLLSSAGAHSVSHFVIQR